MASGKIITLVLGGGQGKRLFPLTSYRSKPAVPIGGKYRLVDIPISNSLNSDLNRIFILTQFNSTSLHRHIHRTYPYEAFHETSIELLAAEQTSSSESWFQGTADAVRKHLSHYGASDEDTFLILSGDHLYRMNYEHILAFHKAKKADVTVATVPVPKREVSGFGIMQLQSNGRVRAFWEKPSSQKDIKNFIIPEQIRNVFGVEKKKELYLASMGIYVFKAEVLKKVLRGQEVDFGKEIIPKAISQSRVYGYVFNGYWRDIGTIRSFYEASLELTKPNSAFQFISQEGRMFTRARFLPPTEAVSAHLTNVLMGEACQLLGARIENSSLGLRSVIRNDTVVKKSVLMGNDFFEYRKPKGKPPLGVGHHCHIEKAILDKNVRVGNYVQIRNANNIQNEDGSNYHIRDGVVIIPKGAIIRDGTKI